MRARRKELFTALLICLAGALFGASATADGAWEYVPPVETHFIRSKYVHQTFKVQVMRPAQKRGELTRFPTIYATDGNFMFDALKGISYSIQRSAHDAPRFILVGIGYPSDSPLAGTLLRARDLTFPGYPRLSTQGPSNEDVLTPEQGAKDYFGAVDFQQFIADELIPFIDEHYETIAGDRTYFGHSAGGGFGLFTLFTRPELFRNYIVSSPSVLYHIEDVQGARGQTLDFALEQARRFISAKRTLADSKLYMSVGAQEEFEVRLAPWQLTSGFFRLAKLMRSSTIPGLSLTTEVFPNETHLTVWPIAFIHGVKTVLDTEAYKNPELGATK